MKFKFKAVKKDGKKYEGTKESTDKFSLYEELKAEGETLLVATPFEKSHIEIEIPFIDKVPEHQKIIFARNLGSMINAGLPLVKGLSILEKQITNKKFKGIIGELISQIKKGEH